MSEEARRRGAGSVSFLKDGLSCEKLGRSHPVAQKTPECSKRGGKAIHSLRPNRPSDARFCRALGRGLPKALAGRGDRGTPNSFKVAAHISKRGLNFFLPVVDHAPTGV